jgi:hypothetical protein
MLHPVDCNLELDYDAWTNEYRISVILQVLIIRRTKMNYKKLQEEGKTIYTIYRV